MNVIETVLEGVFILEPQVFGDARPPELVEVGAGIGRQARAHLQAVGLHAVQRPQHTVQAA